MGWTATETRRIPPTDAAQQAADLGSPAASRPAADACRSVPLVLVHRHGDSADRPTGTGDACPVGRCRPCPGRPRARAREAGTTGHRRRPVRIAAASSTAPAASGHRGAVRGDDGRGCNASRVELSGETGASSDSSWVTAISRHGREHRRPAQYAHAIQGTEAAEVERDRAGFAAGEGDADLAP